MKKIPFFLLVFFLLFSCTNHGQLNYVTKLPKDLKENSGIVSYSDDSAWFIEDRGNGDNLYKVDFKGKFLKKLEVKNAKNRDWEDLTKDGEGNLYIGDFGNNSNNRKDLTIYILPNPETEPGDKIDAEKIAFTYPEQKKYPPKKEERFYDAEAFFHYADHLYIFTKNRANPFSGESLVYKVPAEKGNYKAELVGKLKTCSDWDTCQITSADISTDGKTIVLLGYGKLWLITDFNSDQFTQGNVQEYDLGIRTQLESVCFIDESRLLLSDEESGPEGRNLYSLKLK
ncbi:MAG: hypothetical protein HKN31_14810 [Pricia sp.]|nr:hypothetical protein [Pricia sp.]